MRTLAQRMLIRAEFRPVTGAIVIPMPRVVRVQGRREYIERPPSGLHLRAAVIRETADDTDGRGRGDYPPCLDCGARRRSDPFIPGSHKCGYCGSEWRDTRYVADWRGEALLKHPWWPDLDAEQQASIMAGTAEWCHCGAVVSRGQQCSFAPGQSDPRMPAP